MSEEGNKGAEYFIKVKKDLASDEGFDKFKERVLDFYNCVEDYRQHPLQHTVMADAYMCFFEIDEVEEERWLSESLTSKMTIMFEKKDIGAYLGVDEMVNRCLGFANILFHSGYVLSDPLYVLTANRLLYTLTGNVAVLDAIGTSLYVFPKEKKDGDEGEEIPETGEDHFERLYQ